MLSDFPYDIRFMANKWDKNCDFAKWGTALLPLLHPGAVAMIFGSTRTWHRLAVAMEDSGFEMWDSCMWLHSQGWPKGQDIGSLIDKAAKVERPVVGHSKNGCGNTANSIHNATSGFSAHRSKSFSITEAATPEAKQWDGIKTCCLKPAWEPVLCLKKSSNNTYIQNALQHHCGGLNIECCRIPHDEPVRTCQRTSDKFSGDLFNGGESGHFRDGDTLAGPNPEGRYPANLLLDDSIDLGQVNRYFYAAKSSPRERNLGLPSGVKNNHPCVKPVSLTTYLAKLLLPPAGETRRILVPFSGSGSEILGCLLAGWDEVVGIELSPEFNEIARHRCEAVSMYAK
jgi:site-specific DNA-methyltransferase (adenine-specific)